MSLGFEQAGFDIAAAVEYDPIHCATHEFNFPDCAAICRSVADIDGEYIRNHSRIGRRPVDVLFWGAPCQGFSMIGKRALDDPRNSLVHHFVRLVVELKASYFVFENVRGLTVGAHRKFLEEIILEFRNNGYKVLEDYQVLNAAQYGVPQSRQRLFLMGARRGFPSSAVPSTDPRNREPSQPGKSFPSGYADRLGRPARRSRGRRLRRITPKRLGESAVQEAIYVWCFSAWLRDRSRRLLCTARVRCWFAYFQHAHRAYGPFQEALS